MRLPLRLDWIKASDRWASIINPVIDLAPNQGTLIGPVDLTTGVNQVNHLLQRIPQGWIIVDQNASASIYRSAPFNKLTLTLTTSAPVSVKLWVF